MTTTKQLLDELQALHDRIKETIEKPQQRPDSQSPLMIFKVPTGMRLNRKEVEHLRNEFALFESALREQIAKEIELYICKETHSTQGLEVACSWERDGFIFAAKIVRGEVK